MLLVDDLAAGGTKNLRHTPRGLVTLVYVAAKATDFSHIVLKKNPQTTKYMKYYPSSKELNR